MRGPSSRISAHFEQFGAGTISTRRAFTVPHSSPPLKPRVLRLQPCPRSAAHAARADALRHDAFEVHPARMTKNGGPISGDRLAELDALAHGLVLRDRSFPSLFLRSSRGSGRTSWPASSMTVRQVPEANIRLGLEPRWYRGSSGRGNARPSRSNKRRASAPRGMDFSQLNQLNKLRSMW